MNTNHDVELIRSLLSYDAITGEFTWNYNRGGTAVAGARAGGSGTSKGYRRISVAGKSYLEHRLAWLYTHGELPDCQIDHENLNRSDNRLTNLRLASHAENERNSSLRTSNTSGVKGVHFDASREKWVVQVCAGNRKFAKRYDTIEEAKAAAIEARKELHGEFARHA